MEESRDIAYNAAMLNSEEKAQLQRFIDNSEEGTAYRRRAQILVMYADGVPPETSGPLLGVSIIQARALLRAFKRQRLALFPADLFTSTEEEAS